MSYIYNNYYNYSLDYRIILYIKSHNILNNFLITHSFSVPLLQNLNEELIGKIADAIEVVLQTDMITKQFA